MSKAPGKSIPCLQIDFGDVDEVKILHIADLHTGSEFSDHAMIRKAVADCVENHIYVAIYGDLLEAALRESLGDVHQSKYDVDEEIETIVELLRPLVEAGLLLFIIKGNHDNRIYAKTGLDPIKYICFLLGGVPYLKDEAFVTYSVGDWNHGSERRRPIKYLQYAHHGAGGGSTIGGAANKLAKQSATVVADIYVDGHTHKTMAFKQTVYVPDSKYQSVLPKDQLFINTGSCVDRGGYAIRGGFPPLPKEWVCMTLSGRSKDATAMV